MFIPTAVVKTIGGAYQYAIDVINGQDGYSIKKVLYPAGALGTRCYNVIDANGTVVHKVFVNAQTGMDY